MSSFSTDVGVYQKDLERLVELRGSLVDGDHLTKVGQAIMRAIDRLQVMEIATNLKYDTNEDSAIKDFAAFAHIVAKARRQTEYIPKNCDRMSDEITLWNGSIFEVLLRRKIKCLERYEPRTLDLSCFTVVEKLAEIQENLKSPRLENLIESKLCKSVLVLRNLEMDVLAILETLTAVQKKVGSRFLQGIISLRLDFTMRPFNASSRFLLEEAENKAIEHQMKRTELIERHALATASHLDGSLSSRFHSHQPSISSLWEEPNLVTRPNVTWSKAMALAMKKAAPNEFENIDILENGKMIRRYIINDGKAISFATGNFDKQLPQDFEAKGLWVPCSNAVLPEVERKADKHLDDGVRLPRDLTAQDRVNNANWKAVTSAKKHAHAIEMTDPSLEGRTMSSYDLAANEAAKDLAFARAMSSKIPVLPAEVKAWNPNDGRGGACGSTVGEGLPAEAKATKAGVRARRTESNVAVRSGDSDHSSEVLVNTPQSSGESQRELRVVSPSVGWAQPHVEEEESTEDRHVSLSGLDIHGPPFE